MRIEDIVNGLFPRGYYGFERFRPSESQTPRPRRSVGELPYLCTDLFAVTAILLQRSGAYHHVAPHGPSPGVGRLLGVSKNDRETWIRLGKEWRGEGCTEAPVPPQQLSAFWDALWHHKDDQLYTSLEPTDPPPSWWMPALALMCIADEAASGLGFRAPDQSRISFQARIIDQAIQIRTAKQEAPFSFSTAETDIACILPKSRTPALGCTLRSLSHNLALLPPRGLARAYWLKTHAASIDQESSASKSIAPKQNTLNCLLIPFPFRMTANSFREVRDGNEDWGWFRIEGSWCPATDPKAKFSIEGFWGFLHSLILEAEADCGKVDVIVFPEASLSSVVFREIASRLRETNVELLVSGLFDLADPDGSNCRPGNYAALAVIDEAGLISCREKHHRWKLDSNQIQRYCLGAALDPNLGWWEDIDIISRSLDVYVLRGTTTITTLICEDLARHDPCQELVRGIGPNILFALLMDGPQLRDRWPSRYATVLADDPGSSVLSLTSLALIERSNDSGLIATPSRSIGLWRDDRGETSELRLPKDSHALCLSLYAADFEAHTLDGRGDSRTSESWRLGGVTPIRAPKNEAVEKLVAGQWP